MSFTPYNIGNSGQNQQNGGSTWMSSSQSQSLRYTASLALHQLDHLVSCFNRSRDDLKSVLQRLMTTEEQCARVTKLKMAIAKRSSLNGINASGGDRTLSQAQARVLEARDQLQSTLEQMSAIAGQINAMSCDISSKVGQISSDSALTAYSLGSDQAVFNYEYGELQRAAQIIKDQGRVLRSEVQVKIMQYKHCPVDQYTKLLSTWTSQPLRQSDQDMDNLASMMLG